VPSLRAWHLCRSAKPLPHVAILRAGRRHEWGVLGRQCDTSVISRH
jgi:hypothetical protein